MQNIFRKYLYIIMGIACILLFGVNYFFSGNNLRQSQTDIFNTKLEQIVETMENNEVELSELESATDEDYLTRAQAFAYIIEKEPDVIENQEELERIAVLLNVDELHVSDEYGIIAYSSVPKYVGLDFHGGEQMRGFLPLLEDDGQTEYIIQKTQPNTAEKKMMKYVGVRRSDKKGIVQVGLKPKRLMEAQERNTYSYIFQRIPTQSGESFFAADEQTGEILGSTADAPLKSSNRTAGAETLEKLSAALDKGMFFSLDDKDYFVMARECDSVLLCALIEKSILYQDRLRNSAFLSLYMVILGLILIVALNRLLEKTVISGIHTVLEKLSAIRNGELDTKVEVNGNPELAGLSEGINSMVDSILRTNVKISRILELTEMSLASFECRNDMDKVIYTSRMAELLRLDSAQEETILGNRWEFLKYICFLQKTPVFDEEDIYKIQWGDKLFYLKIAMASDETGSFGTITDVTEDMVKRQKIYYEHDHDALTGLLVYQRFEKMVADILPDRSKTGWGAGIMMDLDKFKNINDTYGHDFGDVYLKHMAKEMLCLPKEHCIAARRSGDEFCLFLYGYSTREELLDAADSFWKQLAEETLVFPDGTARAIGVSGGLAWAQEHVSFPRMMYNADVALYQAKRETLSTYKIFGETKKEQPE